MTLRNEYEDFEAIPFDASSDADEPLVAMGDAEEEDHRLEEKAFSRFKLSSLLLGLLVGFFIQCSAQEVFSLIIINWSKEDITKTRIGIVFLLLSFFIMAILESLRTLVRITYSAAGGRSKDLLEDMILHMELRFVAGSLVGICLASTMMLVILGMRAQIVYSPMALVVALFWYKIMMIFTTDSKPSSSRGSMAEFGDAEEEDPRLEEKTFSRFKSSSLLLGLLVGFFIQCFTQEAYSVVVFVWGEEAVIKFKAEGALFCILWSFFTMAIVVSLHNLVTITYSAAGGRYKGLFEDMVEHMEYRFVVGACLTRTMMSVILGMRAQIVSSLVTLMVILFFFDKITMMCFNTGKKPTSSHKSTAE
jgi:hypothetical protein